MHFFDVVLDVFNFLILPTISNHIFLRNGNDRVKLIVNDFAHFTFIFEQPCRVFEIILEFLYLLVNLLQSHLLHGDVLVLFFDALHLF